MHGWVGGGSLAHADVHLSEAEAFVVTREGIGVPYCEFAGPFFYRSFCRLVSSPLSLSLSSLSFSLSLLRRCCVLSPCFPLLSPSSVLYETSELSFVQQRRGDVHGGKGGLSLSPPLRQL